MKKYLLLLFWIFSGVFCLCAGYWLGIGAFLSFLGFACFWQGQKCIKEHFKHTFWMSLAFSFLFFLCWNVVGTWWIRITGSLWVVSTANSLVMSVAFLFWYWLQKNKILEKWAIPLFAIVWLGFEYAHHYWQLTWVWLTLGNVFLYQNIHVQWYEYTGVLGGSCWILLANIAFYRTLRWEYRSKIMINIGLLLAVVGLPMLLSLYLYQKPLPKSQKINVLLIQPNINPFTEKFEGGSHFIPIAKQVEILLDLARKNIRTSTDLVVFPETAIDEAITESLLPKYQYIKQLDTFSRIYQVPLLVGISTRQFHNTSQSPTSTFQAPYNSYVEDFNTALFYHKNTFELYRKMILVPGVETIPYPKYTIFLQDFISNIGASFFLLGTGKEQKVFRAKRAIIAPIICYESMYGAFIADFVAKDANLLATITNDGWLGDTDWQKHHLYLGALRSIETRKSMIHCSNMGTSGFISAKGNVEATLAYNKRASLAGQCYLHKEQTLYARHGDYIGKIAMLLLFCLVLFRLFHKFSAQLYSKIQ